MVGFRCFSAEPMVEMSDAERPSMRRRERVQAMEEDHGIHAAGQCDQHAIAVREQPPGQYAALDLFHEPMHTESLGG